MHASFIEKTPWRWLSRAAALLLLVGGLGAANEPREPALAAPPQIAKSDPDGPADSAPTLHVFTNRQGVTMKAELIEFNEPNITLKRADKQTFVTDIKIFSDADQAYIRTWALHQAMQQKDGVFTIEATSERDPNKTSVTPDITTTQWNAGYAVTLHDKAGMELRNLRVDYNVFKQNGDTAAAESVTRLTGTTSIVTVADDATAGFSTAKIALQRLQVNAGWIVSNIPTRVQEDRLLGVWLKIYTDQGELIEEWSSSPDVMSTQKWLAPATKPAKDDGGT
jgi:hypothetical protein